MGNMILYSTWESDDKEDDDDDFDDCAIISYCRLIGHVIFLWLTIYVHVGILSNDINWS